VTSPTEVTRLGSGEPVARPVLASAGPPADMSADRSRPSRLVTHAAMIRKESSGPTWTWSRAFPVVVVEDGRDDKSPVGCHRQMGFLEHGALSGAFKDDHVVARSDEVPLGCEVLFHVAAEPAEEHDGARALSWELMLASGWKG